MEPAQVQGLGTTIIRLKLNDPSISKIMETDPNEIVQYLLKLCFVHWERYVFDSFKDLASLIIGLFLQEYGEASTARGARCRRISQ